MPNKYHKVTYKTFVDDLHSNQVTDIQIYEMGEIDLIYKLHDGSERGVERPLGLDKDSLLHYTIEQKAVPMTINGMSYDEAKSDFGLFHFTIYAIYLVPLILAIVVWKQAQTIKGLSFALANRKQSQ